jgi:hypothetical protein
LISIGTPANGPESAVAARLIVGGAGHEIELRIEPLHTRDRRVERFESGDLLGADAFSDAQRVAIAQRVGAAGSGVHEILLGDLALAKARAKRAPAQGQISIPLRRLRAPASAARKRDDAGSRRCSAGDARLG